IDDLLNSDITNGATTSQGVTVDGSGGVTYSEPTVTYFNQLSFTGSSTYSYGIVTDRLMNIDQLYYLEMELYGDVQFDFGTISLSFSATGSMVNTTFRMSEDISTFTVSNTATYSSINNLVISDRLP